MENYEVSIYVGKKEIPPESLSSLSIKNDTIDKIINSISSERSPANKKDRGSERI